MFVCVHTYTSADMYVCTCMWGSKMPILDVIPQESPTVFIEAGYFLGLGLAYWAKLAGLCLSSDGIADCVSGFIADCVSVWFFMWVLWGWNRGLPQAAGDCVNSLATYFGF